MNAYALSIELEKQQSRTRKIAGISLLIHALLALLLLLHRAIVPEAMALTEISWIEPEPVVPVAAAAVVKTRRPVRRTLPFPKQQAEHFVRKTEKSDFAPQPQRDRAVKDRLDRKFASLEQTTQRDRPKIASLAASNISHRPALAAVPDRTENRSGAIDLERTDRPVASPVQLARSEKRPSTAPMKLSTIPEKTVKPATVARADSTARRMIDGMSLVGPVADRMLVKYGRPGYPDWAKREGIEGSVDLYFIVLPSGRVKENVLVQKTSGFEDFDKNAIDALLAWEFELLGGGRTGEQWGAITFDYRLSD
ncbi:MAG: energy transducer TonB [Candidatus Krumholzibacteria bacterium]|nr:energy transducer TonB [Candidatus Krumholzibacteria bacterium]